MAVLMFLLWGCTTGPSPVAPTASASSPQTATSGHGLREIALSVSGQSVIAEVADTNPLRRKGLMHRTSMVPDHGMLFVYPDERERSFWMKNTLLPLSIAYINQGGTIVHMADMEPLDERSVRSLYPAMYALEMPQGWFDAHGVMVGEVISGLPGASQE